MIMKEVLLKSKTSFLYLILCDVKFSEFRKSCFPSKAFFGTRTSFVYILLTYISTIVYNFFVENSF